MRWSIVRLIWLRELRDQLRDRRTIFMIAVLPIVLYPILGVGVMQFALGFLRRPSIVGMYGHENLPRDTPSSPGYTPALAASWLGLTPLSAGGTMSRLATAHVLAESCQIVDTRSYPPLLETVDDQVRIDRQWFETSEGPESLPIKLLPWNPGPPAVHADREDQDASLRAVLSAVDRQPLDAKEVDLLLIVPPDFLRQVAHEGRATLLVLFRDDDDRSRLVNARVAGVLARWKKSLKDIRLVRHGLPVDFDEVFEVQDADRSQAENKRPRGIFDLMVRIFPFLLVLWSLAGALYPAVDLCAGEKERGTMETLLITPASRDEIVWGKFLTIWVFSGATALLNLASMGLTTWQLGSQLPAEAVRPGAILWCVVLVLPMSALFSALCLAIGAYARSSKEGQYYLMPLFLITMPLIFLTLSPGVELNAFYSLVPVTGVALLLQGMMTAPSLEQAPLRYLIPVLVPIVLYSWLALRWAIEQFKSEEVLFREAERLDLRLWFRHLFRDKEPWPNAGQAWFCFGLIVVLRWLSFGLGERWSLVARTSISYVAFVAVPALMMALLLTTRPASGLGLRLPTLRALLVAVPLAMLMLPLLSGLTPFVLEQFPHLKQMLTERNPLTEELWSPDPTRSRAVPSWLDGALLAILPAVCDELAFRGFILSGLRRRFQPWTAIVLGSFLFALYQANVFQVLPGFVLGLVLGMLTVRTGSILPGIVLHVMYNGLLITLAWFVGRLGYPGGETGTLRLTWLLGSGVCTLMAGLLLWRLSEFGYHRWAREEATLLAPPPKRLD
jgi:sodium transport system permease protein